MKFKLFNLQSSYCFHSNWTPGLCFIYDHRLAKTDKLNKLNRVLNLAAGLKPSWKSLTYSCSTPRQYRGLYKHDSTCHLNRPHHTLCKPTNYCAFLRFEYKNSKTEQKTCKKSVTAISHISGYFPWITFPPVSLR